MPIKNSAKKALRQTVKRTAANKIFKDAYKQAIKEVKKLAAEGKDVAEALKLAQKRLDKAAKKGIIKSNTAARKLSRLIKTVGATKK